MENDCIAEGIYRGFSVHAEAELRHGCIDQ